MPLEEFTEPDFGSAEHRLEVTNAVHRKFNGSPSRVDAIISSMFRESLEQLLGSVDGGIVFVTGAGLSAASGIPTFRGKDGYWSVGSAEYRSEELATQQAFRVLPREVWRWYLYRRGVCRRAQPSTSHRVLAELEATLGDAMTLVTQNVDGLHLRAGNSLARCHQIHGNIDFMRCLDDACPELIELMDESLQIGSRDDTLEDSMWERLRCGRCGAPTRPHVLWFDEYYDEALFRAESSLQAARRASVVVTIGTSGATNLPHQVVATAARAGAALIDINPNANPFSAIAEASPRGLWLSGDSDEILPTLADVLARATGAT